MTGPVEELGSPTPKQVLLIKAEALDEEAQRMDDFGHPYEWIVRLRNRAEWLRVQAEDAS